jgi:hypothetical protein
MDNILSGWSQSNYSTENSIYEIDMTKKSQIGMNISSWLFHATIKKQIIKA